MVTEVLPYNPTADSKPSRKDLTSFGNNAVRAYSVFRGLDVFEAGRVVLPDVLQGLGNELNLRLQNDGKIVILTPGDEKARKRLQIIDRFSYTDSTLCFNSLVTTRSVNDEFGGLNVTFGNLGFKDGTVEVDVRRENGAPISSTVWTPDHNPYRRFAILSESEAGWKVILDANLKEDALPPAWKVNRSVLSRGK